MCLENLRPGVLHFLKVFSHLGVTRFCLGDWKLAINNEAFDLQTNLLVIWPGVRQPAEGEELQGQRDKNSFDSDQPKRLILEVPSGRFRECS